MLRDPAFSCLTVSEIALRCGFGDPSYLVRLFRQHYQMTPVEFRQLPRSTIALAPRNGSTRQ